MPEIVTRQLGTIRFEEDAVLHFPGGMPGFENWTRFVLVERSASAPIVFLQSLDSPDLCFFAAPVGALQADYQLLMTDEDQRTLALTADPLSLAILSVNESGAWTANLLAPVVINKEARRAVQAVRSDARYSHQHPLLTEDAPCS